MPEPREFIHYLVLGAKGTVAPWQHGPLCGWKEGGQVVTGHLESWEKVTCPECLKLKELHLKGSFPN